MKTLKIIIAVLLLLMLLPVSGCVFQQENVDVALSEKFEKITVNQLTANEITRFPRVAESLENNTFSLGLLLICTFLFVLAAGIVLIVCRKKFYSALIAGSLVLIVFVWNSSLQKNIQSVANDAILRRLPSITYYEDTSTLFLANFMLFLPMIASLVIGTIETVLYFVKRKKNIAVKETQNEEEIAATEITPQKEANIDELKKYKELLDQGIITQEDYDAKKKELLGL